MFQVELTKIIIDEKRQDQIIVLKEKDGDRQFPIVIGIIEASSIKMKLSGIVPPRPLTHDLLISVVEKLDAEIDRLVIDKMIENTFHAKLILVCGNEEIVVDARPSDGIAIAVRVDAPIYVAEDVMARASMKTD